MPKSSEWQVEEEGGAISITWQAVENSRKLKFHRAVTITSRKAFMVASQTEEQAVKLVKDYWVTAHAKGVRIIDRVPEFLGGYLYIVEVTDANDQDHENLVLFKDAVLRRFDNLRDLAATVPRLSMSERMLDPAFLIPAISGLIALIIVSTICYLAISDPKSKMPEVLASALTLVLGFYFGATSARASKDSLSSPAPNSPSRVDHTPNAPR